MRKIDRSRAEIADTIERFLDGICRPWEWDDFSTVPIVDPQLEAIRLRCAGLSQEYPPIEKGHYCSPAGMAVLRQVVLELRRPRTPN
jgi:hypothetical protein